MEKLVEYIVRSLVDNQSAVHVTTAPEGDSQVITVEVAKEELGRVVGKNGRNAQAIRTIVRSLAGKQGFSDTKYIVNFK